MIDLANLPRMGAFAIIVREGSLTAAAKVLGVSKGSLSEQLRKLEENVGTRLLQRTTRRLSLTEAGEAYYRHCSQMMEEAAGANAAAGAMRAEPTGTLRVTAPHAMGASVVVPSIVAFCLAYPEMCVDLRLSDTKLDLLEHDLDLAIRGGWPADSTLISKKLSSVEMYLCTSPAHVARAGLASTLADLASQSWVLHSGVTTQKTCVFLTPNGEHRKVTATGRVFINSAEGIRSILLRGHGIGVLPAPLIEDDLSSGRLLRLLPDHALPDGGLYAVYPSRQHVSPKVQRFVEILQEQQKRPVPTKDELRAKTKAATPDPRGVRKKGR